jgi:hypothetical protein
MERGVNGMAVSDVEGAERAAGGPSAPPSPDDPKPGETWRHYKGRDYEVVAVGLDEATRTPMIAYRCPESGLTWFRTLANFTEVVEAEGIAARTVPYRRFGRVGRPKGDGTAISQHGKWPTGYPPGSIAERRYREEMEQSFESMGAALDNIRAICRDVAGVDAGSATESVLAVAARVRLLAESVGATDYPEPDVSPIGETAQIESMRDARSALRVVIARLDVMLDMCDEDRLAMALGKVSADADEVEFYLDRAMGEHEGSSEVKSYLDSAPSAVEDAGGIDPHEAPG